MAACNDIPHGVEALQSGSVRCLGMLSIFLRNALICSMGLSGCGDFDRVCNEQMKGYEQIEGEAPYDVVLAVIVAAEADQDSILRLSAWRQNWATSTHLSQVYDHQSQV